ncbi:MAG: pyridoxamine 5'-phosphate oxidase family protein [Coriobacteriales bacterium]|jgi:nitroimidazol reductase NimA-like FMN-containing flavoprotein (pyridoxamine 5'-phosphate oxidase superfamily)|nr:pyridoxamine 5'-phosphate oxidase family protein [Coriobacteriales bacterium]
MRGVVRREARALSAEEASKIIAAAEYGVLATVNKEGQPSTTALNHVLFEDGCLYFHTGIEGEKLDNIQENPQVSFFVVGVADVVYEQFIMSFSSAVVHGTLAVVEGQEEKIAILHKIAARFSDGTVAREIVDDFIKTTLPHVNVLKLTPEHITGKARITKKRDCLRKLEV